VQFGHGGVVGYLPVPVLLDKDYWCGNVFVLGCEIRTRRAFSGHLLQTVTRRGVPKLPGIVAVFPGAAGTAPLEWVPNGPLTFFW